MGFNNLMASMKKIENYAILLSNVEVFNPTFSFEFLDSRKQLAVTIKEEETSNTCYISYNQLAALLASK